MCIYTGRDASSIGSSIESLSNARPIVLSRYLSSFRSMFAARGICNLRGEIGGQRTCVFASGFVRPLLFRLTTCLSNLRGIEPRTRESLKGRSHRSCERSRMFRKRLSPRASLAVMTQYEMYARPVESAQLLLRNHFYACRARRGKYRRRVSTIADKSVAWPGNQIDRVSLDF